MSWKLLMTFTYPYNNSIEIIMTFPVEGQVSTDDERYLCLSLHTFHCLNRPYQKALQVNS